MMNSLRKSAASTTLVALQLAACVIILIVPAFVSDYWLFFLCQVAATAYLALSFDFSYSYARILSFAQGTFFGIGAYVALYLATPMPWGVPLVFGGAILAAAFAGLSSGVVLMRMAGHNPTIATVIVASAVLLAGNSLPSITGGEDGLRIVVNSIGFLGWQLPIGPNLAFYYAMVIPLSSIFLLIHVLQRRTVWKVLQAVAQNEIRAQQLGFDVRTRRLILFVLSAGLAALGGAFYALLVRHVSTSALDISLSVNAILYAVLGGVGTVLGSIVGVLIIFPLTEFIALYFTYVQILIGLTLVIVAIAFPKGILGTLKEVAESETAGTDERIKYEKTTDLSARRGA